MANNDFRTECDRRRAAGFLVTGNTFLVRERLKALGGIWDAYNKGWLMPTAEKAETARALAAPRPKAPKARATATKTPVEDVADVASFEAYPVSAAPVDADMPF